MLIAFSFHIGVKLELITDPSMFEMMERGMFGGICHISKRFARANNPLLGPKYFDPSQPVSFIIYLDANNLYGWAMIQRLPDGGFRWLSNEEIEAMKDKWATLDENSDQGYILEVDLEYPKDLANKHNDYPLAPQRLKVPEKWLSPELRNLLNRYGLDTPNSEKLICHLHGRKNYVVHSRNLAFYLKQGLRVTKVD